MSDRNQMKIYSDALSLPEFAFTGFEQMAKAIIRGKVVYLIEVEGEKVKIGYSSKPKTRVQTLVRQAGAVIGRIGMTPPILNAPEVEASFKRVFKSSKIAGEWYLVDFQSALKFLESQGWVSDSLVSAERAAISEAKRQAGMDELLDRFFQREVP